MTHRRRTERSTRHPAHVVGGELLTLDQVLAELHVTRSTFFKWRSVGKAPRAIKYPNRSLMIRRADLDAWIAEHEESVA
jgi:predicted DNA-binding transcriptional regulator AlpA